MSDWTEIQANWKGEMGFVGKNSTGGTVQMGTVDGKPGVSPMQMLLLGMAGCTGSDVVHMLSRMKEDLTDLSIKVKALRAESHPKVYRDIVVEYSFTGNNLSEKSVQRAIELSEEKFCSVSVMLGKTAKITSIYEIINED